MILYRVNTLNLSYIRSKENRSFLYTHTGFPKKDARFSKIKNIADLLSDDKEGKIMWNIDF